MSWGFVEIAKKTGKPIIPVVTEFTYDTSKEKERITKIFIRFGKPIKVSLEDDMNEKLMEYEEAISTIRWGLFEEKGIEKRKNVTNSDYINFLKGNYKNLKLGNKDWALEKKRMRGAESDFYIFHHINDVPFDQNGRLLETEEVRKLKRINAKKFSGIKRIV